MNPRFKAGDRVVYLSGDDAYLGTVTERVFFVDTWRYAIDWADGFRDYMTRAEKDLRRVH